MVFIRKKKIHDKTYYYLDKTVRLPNNKFKKISKYLGVEKPKEKMNEETWNYFVEKESQIITEHMKQNLKLKLPLDIKEVQKIEKIKIGYNELKKSLNLLTQKDMLYRFIANFTYESNALEGNSLTLKDVNLVMHENLALKNKDLREIYETKNSIKVFDIIKKGFKINHNSIIKIHKMFMQNIDDRVGSYKTEPNFLLMRTVKTTSPKKVYEEMDKLINWLEKNQNKMHTLYLAIIFHSKFEKIHPFPDGNGRVGRFLLNAILMNNGYPPLIIRKSQRAAYFKALDASDHKQDVPIIRFMIKQYKKTFDKFFKIYSKYNLGSTN